MKLDTIVQVLRLMMPGGPHYPTRYGRRSLSRAEQFRRMDAALAKRARRRERNLRALR